MTFVPRQSPAFVFEFCSALSNISCACALLPIMKRHGLGESHVAAVQAQRESWLEGTVSTDDGLRPGNATV